MGFLQPELSLKNGFGFVDHFTSFLLVLEYSANKFEIVTFRLKYIVPRFIFPEHVTFSFSAEATNKLFNDNWRSMFEMFKKVKNGNVEAMVKDNLNKLLASYPYETIFPK